MKARQGNTENLGKNVEAYQLGKTAQCIQKNKGKQMADFLHKKRKGERVVKMIK